MTLDFGILKSKTEEEGLIPAPITTTLIGDAKLRVITSPTDTTERSQGAAGWFQKASIVFTPNSTNHIILGMEFSADIKRTENTAIIRCSVKSFYMGDVLHLNATQPVMTYTTPNIQTTNVAYTNKKMRCPFFNNQMATWGRSSYQFCFEYFGAGGAAIDTWSQNLILTIYYLDYGITTGTGAEFGTWGA